VSDAAVATQSGPVSPPRPRYRSLVDVRGTSAALVRGAVVIGILLALWYVLAWYARATGSVYLTLKVPYPHDVFVDMIERWDTYATAAWQTASRAVIGFAIGSAIGILLGVLMIGTRRVDWYAMAPRRIESHA
jgi:ABC-type nitrate/sulfonate/bicarbonate transport system permease component